MIQFVAMVLLAIYLVGFLAMVRGARRGGRSWPYAALLGLSWPLGGLLVLIDAVDEARSRRE